MPGKGYDPATKNLCHHIRWVAGTVHAKVRELVARDTLRMERAETGFVTKKRTAGHGRASRKQNIDGRIEPQDGNSGVAQKFRRTHLRIGAAAERDNRGFLPLQGTAQSRAELFGFQLPEGRFAVPFEELRNGDARSCLDLFVQVNEPPAELLGQTRANRALAGTHETGKAKDRSSRHKAAWDESLTHDSGKRRSGTLQNSDCTTVGGEFDFRESAADRAEQALSEPGGDVPHAVRVRAQERFGLIVHRAGGGLRV